MGPPKFMIILIVIAIDISTSMNNPQEHRIIPIRFIPELFWKMQGSQGKNWDNLFKDKVNYYVETFTEIIPHHLTTTTLTDIQTDMLEK